MKKIQVLLVDDRDIIRDAVKLTFKNSKQIEICDEAENGLAALKCIQENDYDVILMDINMPNMDGIETTRRILQIKPTSKILCFSFLTNIHYIKEMIENGVMGYITKDADKETLVEAIKTAYNNEIYLEDEINNLIMRDYITYLKLCS